MLQDLKNANARKHINETFMNQRSSRSHTIMTFNVKLVTKIVILGKSDLQQGEWVVNPREVQDSEELAVSLHRLGRKWAANPQQGWVVGRGLLHQQKLVDSEPCDHCVVECKIEGFRALQGLEVSGKVIADWRTTWRTFWGETPRFTSSEQSTKRTGTLWRHLTRSIL